MANSPHDGIATNSYTQEHTITTKMTEKHQRQLKPGTAEKADEERQGKWALRADVVYHFFAYRYFDRSAMCLDLLNFSDSDVDSFNLTANKARGLDNWHKCAEYLKNITTPAPETNTHRRKLIYHIRSFNKTQAPHFRFYIRNLTADDVEYVEGLCKAEKKAVDDSAIKETALVWATSCVEDEFAVAAYEEPLHTNDIDPVEVAIEKCLEDYRQSLHDRVPNIAKATQENGKQVEANRDEFSKQSEQLGPNNNNNKGSANGMEKGTANVS